jgi:alkylation response protein AidB-like acyl-CoA dehydrogenase
MTTARLVPPPAPLPAEASRLRADVRRFLADELSADRFAPECDSWLSGWDEGFSRRLAERGWVGMTIPPKWGGGGRGALDRYVVTEELLAAGAPVAAHWIADRQIAPSLLRYGSDLLKRRYLPEIAAGTCYFGIGLSEPDAGSDLAGVRTRATRDEGGWRVSGTKVWTSGAHRARAFIALLRTAPAEGSRRHTGLSQFVVEFDQPGVTINPIVSMTGEHHFNEVVLDNVFIADSSVLGTIGNGWAQATSELAYERSGPERFLSTLPLLISLVDQVRSAPAATLDAGAIGGLVSRLWACRQMSLAVAGALAGGEAPEVAAALVKDVGTRLEVDIVETARQVVGAYPDPGAGGFATMLAHALLHSPGFTLRGGTNEILRSVIARALGLR